jgi:hypothetical protein
VLTKFEKKSSIRRDVTTGPMALNIAYTMMGFSAETTVSLDIANK